MNSGVKHQAPSHSICLYKHLWKNLLLFLLLLLLLWLGWHCCNNDSSGINISTRTVHWELHGMDFHVWAASIGLMCRWSSSFIHIMYRVLLPRCLKSPFSTPAHSRYMNIQYLSLKTNTGCCVSASPRISITVLEHTNLKKRSDRIWVMSSIHIPFIFSIVIKLKKQTN